MSKLLELIDQAMSEAMEAASYGAMAKLALAKVAEQKRIDQGARQKVAAQERVARLAVSVETRRAVQAKVATAPVVATRTGPGMGNIKGLTLGPWKVLHVEERGIAAGPTPKWQCQCVGCGAKRLVNGAQLRNKPPACGGCGRAA